MPELKPKDRHEQLLANADKEKIARQCGLFIHFLRLWQMRVTGLDPQLSSESYMQQIYSNRNALYKKLIRPKPSPA